MQSAEGSALIRSLLILGGMNQRGQASAPPRSKATSRPRATPRRLNSTQDRVQGLAWPTTRRKGMPVKSASLNLTPGLASRSCLQNSDARGFERRDQNVHRGTHPRVVELVDDDDGDMERRQAHRPEDAVLVVPLLDGGGDHARDADAVAAHEHHLRLLRLVQVVCLERLRIFGPELERVADLDALEELHLAAAARARVLGVAARRS